MTSIHENGSVAQDDSSLSSLSTKKQKLITKTTVDQLFIRDLAAAASSDETFAIDPQLDREKKRLQTLKDDSNNRNNNENGENDNQPIEVEQSNYNLDVLAQYPNIQALRESSNDPSNLLSPQRFDDSLSDSVKKRKRSCGRDEENYLKAEALQLSQAPLYEVAAKVQQGEAGPKAERWRQLYGMTWLLKSCQEIADENVPRNHIYARYVEVCAELGVRNLSPASFGKLVRIIYPDVKTRRLGVRGHSRYHYCGLKLLGDLNNPNGQTPRRIPVKDDEPRDQQPLEQQQLDPKFNDNFSQAIASPARIARYSGVFSDMDDISLSQRHSKEFSIPDLRGFLIERGIDDYNVNGELQDLHDLYWAHCRLLIDALRFMQIKQFFTNLDNLINKLGPPSKSLLDKDPIIEWIAIVDTLMYKEMVEIISPLALQEIPSNVAAGLKNLAVSLPTHIGKMDAPPFMITVKLAAAGHFIRLVNRLLQVNDAALNAGRILISSADIDNMRQSWARHVNPAAIVSRELACASQDVVDVLQHDVPKLLSITEELFDESKYRQNRDGGKDDPYSRSEAAIVKWGLYMASLPARFPNIAPRLFLLTSSTVLTSALRDISIGGGEGFGPWWIVRCWIDEWMAWMAELGGYLAGTGLSEETSDGVEHFLESVDPSDRQLVFLDKSAACLGLVRD